MWTLSILFVLASFFAIWNSFFKCGLKTNLKSYTEVVDSLEVDLTD